MPQPNVARARDPIQHSMAKQGLVSGAWDGLLHGVSDIVDGAEFVVVGIAVGFVVPGVNVGVAAVVAGHLIVRTAAGAAEGHKRGASQTMGAGTLAPGSTTVFVEGRGIIRARTDAAPICVMHKIPSPVAMGSDTVFVEGMPVARLGDLTVCGASIADGSETVFIGGASKLVAGMWVDAEVPTWVSPALTAVQFAGAAIEMEFSVSGMLLMFSGTVVHEFLEKEFGEEAAIFGDVALFLATAGATIWGIWRGVRALRRSPEEPTASVDPPPPVEPTPPTPTRQPTIRVGRAEFTRETLPETLDEFVRAGGMDPPTDAQRNYFETQWPNNRERMMAQLAIQDPNTVYRHYLSDGGFREIMTGSSLRAGTGQVGWGGGDGVRAFPGRFDVPQGTIGLEFTSPVEPSLGSFQAGWGAHWRMTEGDHLPINVQRIVYPDGTIAVPTSGGNYQVTQPNGTSSVVPMGDLPGMTE